MMDHLSPAAPGWHGKLPTVGDFATRRLPHDFIEIWDGWLSEGLQSLQRQESWPGVYLNSPIWRFVLMPGALPGLFAGQAWAGILMPSVDRVGRYYPLTVAQCLQGVPCDTHSLDALWRWLHQLDDAAADALHEDWSIDQLECELSRIGAAPPPGTAVDLKLDDPPVERCELADSSAQTWLGARATRLLAERLQGRALWYADGDRPEMLNSRGLESGQLVALLLGGRSKA
jgi:type VI secretion system protein ImpM